DDPRVPRLHDVVAETVTLHDAGAEILHQHVGLLGKGQGDLSSFFRRQIKNQALLVAIVGQEDGCLAAALGRHVEPGVVATGWAFYIYDRRAEIPLGHRAERAGDDPGEVEDADTLGRERFLTGSGAGHGAASLLVSAI